MSYFDNTDNTDHNGNSDNNDSNIDNTINSSYFSLVHRDTWRQIVKATNVRPNDWVTVVSRATVQPAEFIARNN